jgi:putative DNA primase/helicase
VNSFEIIAAIIDAAVPVEAPQQPDARPRARPKANQTGGRRQAAAPIDPSPAHGAAPADPPVAAGAPAPPADTDPPAPSGAAAPAPLRVAASSSAGVKKSSRTGELGEKVSGQGSGRGGDELNRRLAWLPQTDLGNVERFVARFGDRLKWCQGLGWLYFDGKRWSRDGAEGYVLRAEHETVRMVQEEAKAVLAQADEFAPMIEDKRGGNVVDPDAKRAKKKVATERKKHREELIALAGKLRKWGRDSEMSARLSPMNKRAKGMLEVPMKAFDADPLMINVANGTLVVRRPEACPPDEPLIVLKAHDAADMITKISPVTYDPSATCPKFDGYLLQVQPNERQRRFIMQWHGLSLTGDVSEQRMVVYWGRGRNGKGVLMETCAYVAGDYADSVPVETFLANPIQKSGSAATPDLAKLPGVRYLRTGEPEKGSKLGEALIKRVTGGDPIDARDLNKGFFTFFPQFKLTIACNYKPKIGGSDEGIWGRMTLVPWLAFIPPEQRDRQLGAKLRDEASGILNRLLDGLRDWLEHGLVLGEEIEAATAAYRRDSDDVGRFLEDCVVMADTDTKTAVTEMHATYIAWARVNGGPAYSVKSLSVALTDRGFESRKISSMFWIGVKLVKSVNDFVDYEGKPLRDNAKAAPDNDHRRGSDDDDLLF